jgi:hypothetical protein
LNPDFGDIPIIDTHEHLAKVYHWRPEVVGLLHFVLENHYLMAGVAAGDSKCAGRDWMDEGATPYWALTKAEGVVPAADEEAGMAYIIERLPTVALTSDWKAFEITLRELYGLDGFLVTRPPPLQGARPVVQGGPRAGRDTLGLLVLRKAAPGRLPRRLERHGLPPPGQGRHKGLRGPRREIRGVAGRRDRVV